MKLEISNCCGAPVKVAGAVPTHFYVCRECLEPCDLAMDVETLDIHPIFE